MAAFSVMGRECAITVPRYRSVTGASKLRKILGLRAMSRASGQQLTTGGWSAIALSIDHFAAVFPEFMGFAQRLSDMTLRESQQVHQWAYRTFGELELGNRQRTRRVVSVAGSLAARAAGTVTEVFADSAEREGAYRLLSNESITAEQLRAGMCDATARQCAEHRKVYVAVDGSSLSLTDRKDSRGVGGVGAWKDHGKGLQVVTALALEARGVPLGVCAQQWWARTERSPKRPCNRRKLDEKETRFSVCALQQAAAHLRQEAPDTHAIFVVDRASIAGRCCKRRAPSRWGLSCAPSTTDDWPRRATLRCATCTKRCKRNRCAVTTACRSRRAMVDRLASHACRYRPLASRSRCR